MRIQPNDGIYIKMVHYNEVIFFGPFKSIRAAHIYGNRWEKQNKGCWNWELLTDPIIRVVNPN